MIPPAVTQPTTAAPGRTVLLVNPNTSTATTALMLAAARAHLPPGWVLRGVEAAQGPSMIVDAPALAAAAAEVVRLATAAPGAALGAATGAATDVGAVVVAAFGDPGVAQLRQVLRVPAMGIGEAGLREAAARGRFGVATTTPGLVDAIGDLVRSLGLEAGFTGVRIAAGGPETLAADPARQAAALADAAAACLARDGADAVVVGGGPLSGAAAALRDRFGDRVVAPVPAAMRWLARTPTPLPHASSTP